MNKTKFAIGCLVQWYECDIIGEYIETLKEAIDEYLTRNKFLFAQEKIGFNTLKGLC